jgi:hypothetical protein
MKKRKLKPTPATITSLMDAHVGLAIKLAKTDRESLKYKLSDVMELWGQLEEQERTMAHYNAVLNACVPAAHVGGYEVAKEVYEGLLEEWEVWKESDKDKAPSSVAGSKRLKKTNKDKGDEDDIETTPQREPLKPDIRTLTTMIRVCANVMEDRNAYSLVMKIWDEDVLKFKIDIDEQLVNSVLLACTRVSSSQFAARGISIAQYAYNLPLPAIQSDFHYIDNPGPALKSFGGSQSKRSLNPTHSLKMDYRTLDILQRLAVKLRQPSLGLQYFEMAQTRGVQLDKSLLDGLMYLLIPAQRYEKAWEMLERVSESFSENKEDGDKNGHRSDVWRDHSDKRVTLLAEPDGISSTTPLEEMKLRVCAAAITSRFQDSLAMMETHRVWAPRGYQVLEEIVKRNIDHRHQTIVAKSQIPTSSQKKKKNESQKSTIPQFRFPPQTLLHIMQILNCKTRPKHILAAHMMYGSRNFLDKVLRKLSDESRRRSGKVDKVGLKSDHHLASDSQSTTQQKNATETHSRPESTTSSPKNLKPDPLVTRKLKELSLQIRTLSLAEKSLSEAISTVQQLHSGIPRNVNHIALNHRKPKEDLEGEERRHGALANFNKPVSVSEKLLQRWSILQEQISETVNIWVRLKDMEPSDGLNSEISQLYSRVSASRSPNAKPQTPSAERLFKNNTGHGEHAPSHHATFSEAGYKKA